MSKNVACGRREQGRRYICIDSLCKPACCVRAFGERTQDRGFASETVAQERCQAIRRIGDRCAVPWQEHRPLMQLQAAQRGHERGEVAVGRRNQGTCPTHDKITRKKHLAGCEPHVISEVAGQMQGCQAPARARHLLSVGKTMVWTEPGIDTFTAARQSARGQGLHIRGATGLCVAEGEYGGAGALGERWREL